MTGAETFLQKNMDLDPPQQPPTPLQHTLRYTQGINMIFLSFL